MVDELGDVASIAIPSRGSVDREVTRLGESVVEEVITADASSECNVLLHQCDSPSVHGAEIGVLKEANHIGLSAGSESLQSLGREPQLPLERVADLPD